MRHVNTELETSSAGREDNRRQMEFLVSITGKERQEFFPSISNLSFPSSLPGFQGISRDVKIDYLLQRQGSMCVAELSEGLVTYSVPTDGVRIPPHTQQKRFLSTCLSGTSHIKITFPLPSVLEFQT